MQSKKRIFRKSIFYRLIITFVLILAPIYLLGVGIHQWGVAIIRRETVASMDAQITYHKLSFDEEMSRMLSSLSECMSDEDLLKLSNIPQSMSDFEKAKSLNRLATRLLTLKNSSIYIVDAKAIVPILDRTISANNGVVEISEEELDTCNNFPSYYNIMENDGGKLFLKIRSLEMGGRKPHFILQIELSNEMIQSTIELFNTYEGSGSLFYYPDKDFIISTTDDLDTPIVEYLKEAAVEGIAPNDEHIVEVDGTNYFAFYRKLDYDGIWMVAYVPENQVIVPFRIYMYLLWVFTIISIAIILYFSFTTHKFLQRPLSKLVKAFHRVEGGELDFAIEHSTNDEFGYIYRRFNAMVEYIHNLINQVYMQKVMTQKAELKQMQSQINPHFFYNSFFILQKMVQRDEKESAMKFSNYLARYFQYVTRNQNDDIELSKEIEHSQNYLEIQVIRFTNIDITFDEVSEKYSKLMVPRLILQPIIENIFEHGFTGEAKKRIVSVKFAEKKNGLYCYIEDNGVDVDEGEIENLNQLLKSNDHDVEITGLVNVHKRINLKFGGESGLQISKSDLGGLKVTILFEEERNENNEETSGN